MAVVNSKWGLSAVFFVLSLLLSEGKKLLFASALRAKNAKAPANKQDNEKVRDMYVFAFIVTQMYKLFDILYNKFLTQDTIKSQRIVKKYLKGCKAPGFGHK